MANLKIRTLAAKITHGIYYPSQRNFKLAKNACQFRLKCVDFSNLETQYYTVSGFYHTS